MRKWKKRDVKYLVQGSAACKEQNCDSNPGSLTESILYYTSPNVFANNATPSMKLYNGFPLPLGSCRSPGILGLCTTWHWHFSLPSPSRVFSSTCSESAMLTCFIYVHVSSALLVWGLWTWCSFHWISLLLRGFLWPYTSKVGCSCCVYYTLSFLW